MKILVIEDNPADMEIIREYLLEHPIHSLQVLHGRTLSEGIQRTSEESVDVILLDLGLPDSQGIATLRSIRSLRPELPIVVLTGLNDEEMGLLALQEGAQEYLVKNQMNAFSLVRSIRYAYERNGLKRSWSVRMRNWRRARENTVRSWRPPMKESGWWMRNGRPPMSIEGWRRCSVTLPKR
jgi:FOG: CheY-like receiver